MEQNLWHCDLNSFLHFIGVIVYNGKNFSVMAKNSALRALRCHDFVALYSTPVVRSLGGSY
ncbi:hypothetical protein AKJ16_DCAP12359 [Drosera capensis]